MSYTLVIVESPSKCKKIEEYLGADYKCIASFGHITELDGLESIDLNNNFTPTFRQILSKSQQIEKIRLAINSSSDILLATDDDREGEAIAWHLCNIFNLNISTTKRIIFHEITQSAILYAVRNPIHININLVYAQLSRQILDLLVGYKISPILWKQIKCDKKMTLSAGRCQIPALRLLYDNQLEINTNPGKNVYITTGYFTKKMLPFILNYEYDNELDINDFLEKSVNFTHIYNIEEPRNVIKKQPLPFTTSTIQQAASNEFKMSPKETMSICQKLYENGHITYMRTDSIIYSSEFINNAKTLITNKYGLEYINQNIDGLCILNETNTITQEAHEAIRPTLITIEELPELDKKENKMYKMIWKNTIESCMEPSSYNSITANITAPDEKLYIYSTEQVIFPGWKIVAGYETDNKIYSFMQHIKNTSEILYKKIVSNITLKQLKSHYSEAALINLLEKKGIGRPSTFSSLIDKIQQRAYVKLENIEGTKINCKNFELIDDCITIINTEKVFGNEKNKMVIQPIGIIVLEFLIANYNNLFQYDYTKYMEDVLDNIAKGNKIWYELCSECDAQINISSQKFINQNSTQERKSIKIDANNYYMIGKNGPVIMNKYKNKTTFKSAKKDLDLDKLKNGEYKLKDIIESNIDKKISGKYLGKSLGKYNDMDVFLKKGQFGLFITWGENSKSIKTLNKPETEIILEDIIPFLNSQKININNANLIRKLNANLSIKNGKYGDYIYYKTNSMTKPKFLDLKKFTGDYKTAEINILLVWISDTHNIRV